MREVSLDVWGDFACFSQPEAKVERMTYPFPTPSAARGILSAIYMKPAEFHWEIRRIEVMKPIRYISFVRREMSSTLSEKSEKSEYTSDDLITLDDYVIKRTDGKEKIVYKHHTLRQTVALQDVYYRITAAIVPQPAFQDKTEQLYEQAMRRIRVGKCYFQPAMGNREFVAYFKECDETMHPIDESLDAGWMLYDVFDLNDCAVHKKAQPKISMFQAVMKHGVIEIPPYESADVRKGGEAMC